jgi:hypothetical protein
VSRTVSRYSPNSWFADSRCGRLAVPDPKLMWLATRDALRRCCRGQPYDLPAIAQT